MQLAILEAPSILGLKPTGVETLPKALLQAGLIDRLHAGLPGRVRHAGRVVPDTAYDATRDPVTLTLNAAGIVAYSRTLADAVGALLDRGEFPIVLGGDCSIVLGDLLALRRRGRYGLLFIDGHADFYQPEVNPNGEAASMDLAFATGRGPDVLTNIEGRRPLVLDEDVVVFGSRDAEEQAEYGSQALPPTIMSIDLPRIRSRGIDACARDAVAHLTREGGPGSVAASATGSASGGGFWIHVDADVLDDGIMPAVDYRLAGGLSWDELATVIRTAVDSQRAVGLELTIYNPSLDPGGDGARGLVRVIGDALAGRDRV